MVAYGPREYGYAPGSSSSVESGGRSAGVYSGFTSMPSAVVRVSVSTGVPLSSFVAIFTHDGGRVQRRRVSMRRDGAESMAAICSVRSFRRFRRSNNPIDAAPHSSQVGQKSGYNAICISGCRCCSSFDRPTRCLPVPPSASMAASSATYSTSWSQLESSWACNEDNSVLQRNPRTCLLVATCLSQHDPYKPHLLRGLQELLSTFPWTRAMLNFFGATSDATERWNIASTAMAAHRRIASTFVPGFKTLFWRRALTPALLAGFSHLFLFDSDMVVRPSEFDLVGLLRIQEVMNASIIAPSPYGDNPGTYHLGMARCPESLACSCSPDPRARCAACREPSVEVKVPLFTRDAWLAVYEHLLSRLPLPTLIADKMIDLVWCFLLEHRLHGGCAPASDPGKPDPACVAKLGRACAVSFATPIRHLNHHTIDRDYKKLGTNWNGTNWNSTAACAVAPGSSVCERDGRPFLAAVPVYFAPVGTAAMEEDAPPPSPPMTPPTPSPPPPPFPNGTSLLLPRALGIAMNRLGLGRYAVYPSWRAKGSLLTEAGPEGGGPCFSEEELRVSGALDRPARAYRRGIPVVARFPPRHEWGGWLVELAEVMHLSRGLAASPARSSHMAAPRPSISLDAIAALANMAHALPRVPRLTTALTTPALAGRLPYSDLDRFWANSTRAAAMLEGEHLRLGKEGRLGSVDSWGAGHPAAGYTRVQREEMMCVACADSPFHLTLSSADS